MRGFFTKYPGVLTVLFGYFVNFGRSGLFNGVYYNPSDEVLVGLSGIRAIDLSWDESCFGCIRGSKYDG